MKFRGTNLQTSVGCHIFNCGQRVIELTWRRIFRRGNEGQSPSRKRRSGWRAKKEKSDARYLCQSLKISATTIWITITQSQLLHVDRYRHPRHVDGTNGFKLVLSYCSQRMDASSVSFRHNLILWHWFMNKIRQGVGYGCEDVGCQSLSV